MRLVDQWDPVVVTETRDLTPSVREIGFEAPWEGAHPPGAHIDVEVLIDGRPDTRSYSLVGEAVGRQRRIAVKSEAESRGGSRYMWSLTPGARLKMKPPSNSFELSANGRSYLLIAGGIGVTPMVGMAAVLARRGAHLRMLYAARSRGEMAYIGELNAILGDRLILHPGDEAARMDMAAAFAQLAPDAEAYVCGPIRMLEAAQKEWAVQGRPRANLRFETFGSSGRYAPERFVVHIPRLGRDVVVPENRSMLDALEEAGVGIVADCKKGECGLCVVEILDVKGVVDHRDVFLSEHQHQENRKLCTCVSRVVGEITIDPAYRGDQVLPNEPHTRHFAQPGSAFWR